MHNSWTAIYLPKKKTKKNIPHHTLENRNERDFKKYVPESLFIIKVLKQNIGMNVNCQNIILNLF